MNICDKCHNSSDGMCDEHSPHAYTSAHTTFKIQPHMQAQAPICPFCCDDHASHMDCNPKDLKKELLIIQIEKFFRTCNDEKQDGRLPDTIKNMVRWL